MAEWQAPKHEIKKAARADKRPAWIVKADDCYERSGARFMMQQPKSNGARRPPRMHLVVLSGVPGSGKSHLTAELNKRGFVIVSQDKLGSRQKCEEEVARCIKENRKCVVDRCNHTNQQRDLWLGIADKYGSKRSPPYSLVVHLDTPPATAKARVKSRRDHPTLPPEKAGVVDQFVRETEPIKQPRSWRITGDWDAKALALDIDLSGPVCDERPAKPPAPPPPPPPPPVDETPPLERLMAMGWPKNLCEAALLNAQGDEAAAVDLLLTKSAADLGI